MFDVQKRCVSTAGICLYTLFSCVVAHAERADRNQPIYVQADRWTHDAFKQISTLSGRAVVTQGTTLLKGDHVVIQEDPEGYYLLSSTAGHGVRAYFRSKRDRVDEYIEGEAERIEYDGKNDIAVLSGCSVVRSITGSEKVIDEIHGSVIHYDGQQQLYTADRSANGSGNPAGQVRAILSPRTGAASFKEGASVPLDISPTLNRKTRP